MAQRYGYRNRVCQSCASTVVWRRPTTRNGSYFTGFLERGRMPERALTAVIQEARIQGVCTRSFDDLMHAKGMSGTSKSQVSRPCQEIYEKV